MPTLEIAGREVDVGDDFLKLSPAEQGAAVDHIASQLGVKPRATDASAPKVAGSGLVHGLAGAAGMPVDLGAEQPGVNLLTPGASLPADIADVADQRRAAQAARGNAPLPGSSEHLQQLAHDNLGTLKREEVPEDMQWLFNAGDALGNAAPFVAGGAALGGGKALLREAGAALGASQGGAVAGLVAPDSEGANAVGQVAGSLMSPASIAGRLAGPAAGPLKRAAGTALAPVLDPVRGTVQNVAEALPEWLVPERVKTFAKGGEERKLDDAARILAPQFEKSGEDAAAAAARLDNPDVAAEAGKGFLPAEQSGSGVMGGVQEQLAAKNPELRQVLDQRKAAASDSLMSDAKAVTGEGDAADLIPQAQLEQTVHEATVSRALDGAERRARTIMDDARLNPDAGAREAANVEARNIVDDAVAQLKEQERGLWNRLPLHRPIDPNGMLNAAERVRTRLLPGENLPGPVQRAIDHVQEAVDNGDQVPARVVQNIRSRLLTLSRDAAAAGENGTAAIHREIANGALEDLAQVPGSERARAFSRDMHDRVDRTFAGVTQRSKANGADRVAPTQTLEAAYSAGNDLKRAQQFEELRNASGGLSGEMAGRQEDYLRQRAAADLADPASGALKSPTAAAAWVQKHSATLDAFPELRRQVLQAANVTGAHLEHIDQVNRTADIARQQSAWAQVLKGGEDPSRVISDALTKSKYPVRDVRELSRLAARGGEDAKRGMFSSAWDVAVNDATKGAKEAGGFWTALGKRLHEPLSPKGPGLVDVLHTEGVITTTERARIKQIVDRGAAMEAADKGAKALNPIVPEKGALATFLLRFIGASYGSKISIPGHLKPNSLQAGGYGATVVSKLFDKLPKQQAMDLLTRSMTDPALMKRLLERTASVSAKESLTDALKRAVSEGKTAGGFKGSVNWNPAAVTAGAALRKRDD